MGGDTTENMKHYVDFAARSGFEYMLVDAGWSERNDITRMNGRVDTPELVIDQLSVTQSSALRLHLARGGGAAIRIRPR